MIGLLFVIAGLTSLLIKNQKIINQKNKVIKDLYDMIERKEQIIGHL